MRLDKKEVLKYFKSEKGGISSLIFEIVVSVLILSLLIVVIYVFRNDMDIIGSSANRVNEISKLQSDSIVPLEKALVKGSEVISVIRYFCNDSSVEIDVIIGAVMKRYVAAVYDSQDFVISYEDSFASVCEYEGTKIIKVMYTKK